MTDSEKPPNEDSDRIVERNETYDHTEYGTVEVTGIWKGVDQVDDARNTDQKDVIIVRYSTKDDGEQVDELTDTIDEFLKAIS